MPPLLRWLPKEEEWLENRIIADQGRSRTTDKLWLLTIVEDFKRSFPCVSRANPGGVVETDFEVKVREEKTHRRVKKWIQNHQQSILKKHERNEPQSSFERLVAEQKKRPSRSKSVRDIATRHDPVVQVKRAELYVQFKAKTITQSEMVLALNSTVTDRLRDEQLRASYSEMTRRSNSSGTQSSQANEFGANSISRSFRFVQYDPSPAAVEQEEETVVIDTPLPHPNSSVDASYRREALALVPSSAMQGATGSHTASTIPPSPAITSVLQDQEPVAAMYFEGGHYSLPNCDNCESYRTTFSANTWGQLSVSLEQTPPHICTDSLVSSQDSLGTPQYDEHSLYRPAISTDHPFIQVRSTPLISTILPHGAYIPKFQGIEQHYPILATSARRIPPGQFGLVDPSRHVGVSSRSHHSEVSWSPAGGWYLQKFISRSTAGIYCVAFSYDGRFIASGHTWWHRVEVCDLDSGHIQVLETKMHCSTVTAITFSPDGRNIVSAHGDGSIFIIDLQTGNEISKVKIHQGSIYAMAFSPDGNNVVSGDHQRNILVWNFQAGTIECVLHEPRHPPHFLDFSADGMFVMGHNSQHGIDIWNALTGKSVPLSSIDGSTFLRMVLR